MNNINTTVSPAIDITTATSTAAINASTKSNVQRIVEQEQGLAKYEVDELKKLEHKLHKILFEMKLDLEIEHFGYEMAAGGLFMYFRQEVRDLLGRLQNLRYLKMMKYKEQSDVLQLIDCEREGKPIDTPPILKW